MSTEKMANPAPLGLMAFGLTTVLLNIHNAGFYPMTSLILALGLCFGGMAQVIAGVLEFIKGNTFGLTAFTSYGCFWLSLVVLLIMPKLGLAEANPEGFMACFFFVWGVFTLFMFIGTLRAGRGLQCIFLSLTVLFFLLCARDVTGNQTIAVTAGWVGILCGGSAIYVAMAEVLAAQYGRKVLPF